MTGLTNVSVLSVFDLAHPPSTAAVNVRALQYYNFQVSISGPNTQGCLPGEVVEFQLRVSNMGNGMDSFTPRAVFDPIEFYGFSVGFDPPVLSLERDANGSLTVIVWVPTDSLIGEFDFEVEISSSSTELPPVAKEFSIDVGQAYSVVLLPTEQTRSTIPGGLLEYQVVVTNAGNGQDSFNGVIENVPPGWTTVIQPPEVTLLPGANATVMIRVYVPADSEEAPIGYYALVFVVDSIRGKASAISLLILEVEQFFRVEWMYAGEPLTSPAVPYAQPGLIRPLRSFNPMERDTIDITLEVKNYGNGNDNVTLIATSPEWQVSPTVTPSLTLLMRDQTKFIKVSITVDTDLDPGVYDVLVYVSSQDPEFETRIMPIDFEVVGVDVSLSPTPTYVDPEMGPVVLPHIVVGPGTDMTFRLTVTNPGTHTLTSVQLRGFDGYEKDGTQMNWNFLNLTMAPLAAGDTIVLGAGPFTEANPRLEWRARTSGVHVLEFWAYYDHQWNTTNDVSTVTVTVDAPPVVEVTTTDLVFKKGQTMSISGTTDDDNSNIVWVRARVDQGEWMEISTTSEWTLEMETESLPKGEHILEVVAFDGHTESTVVNATFKVESMFKADESPGFSGIALVLVLISTASMLGLRRRVNRG
jgi:uncharacterized membrane protein